MDNHGLAFVSYYFRYSQYVIRGLKNKVGGPMLTTSFFLAASFPQQLTSTLRSSIPCVVPVEPLPNSGKKNSLWRPKSTVYSANNLPTLLYGSELWTTYSRHKNALEHHNWRSFRRFWRSARRTNALSSVFWRKHNNGAIM